MMDNEKVLSKIFFRRLKIDFQEHDGLKDTPLLGEELNIPARELVLIYFDIKKEFHVEIPEEEILKGNFKSFNNIISMINRLNI